MMTISIFRRLCGVFQSLSSPSSSPSLYFPHSGLYSAPGDCTPSCYLLVRYFRIIYVSPFRISVHKSMFMLIKYHHLYLSTSVTFKISEPKICYDQIQSFIFHFSSSVHSGYLCTQICSFCSSNIISISLQVFH